MRKITLSDILDIAQYERVRPQRLLQIMEHKNARRLEIGPFMWLSFETFETMLHQVQEIMRIERLVDERRILREIKVYNELIPERNQLSASLFIAVADERMREEFLRRAVDLPQHCFLVVDGNRFCFSFDERQNRPDRLNTLQFLSLHLSDELAERFSDTQSCIRIVVDHPLYAYEKELSPELKQILAYDLRRE